MKNKEMSASSQGWVKKRKKENLNLSMILKSTIKSIIIKWK